MKHLCNLQRITWQFIHVQKSKKHLCNPLVTKTLLDYRVVIGLELNSRPYIHYKIFFERLHHLKLVERNSPRTICLDGKYNVDCFIIILVSRRKCWKGYLHDPLEIMTMFTEVMIFDFCNSSILYSISHINPFTRPVSIRSLCFERLHVIYLRLIANSNQ